MDSGPTFSGIILSKDPDQITISGEEKLILFLYMKIFFMYAISIHFLYIKFQNLLCSS